MQIQFFTRHARNLFLFWPVITFLGCGTQQEAPLSNGTYRFVGASLLIENRHAQVLCQGQFQLELKDSVDGREVIPRGDTRCEAPSQPAFQFRWGGDCTLETISFIQVNNRLQAERPRMGCETVSQDGVLWLRPLPKGFVLETTSKNGLMAEYIFERE